GVLALSVGAVFLNAAIPADAAAGGYAWSESAAFAPDLGPSAEMGEDGLRILILTDQHYTRVFGDGKTDRLADALIRDERPDLILLLGDQCFTPFNRSAYKRLIAFMDARKIPWAAIFGNHDEQGKATKNLLADMLSKSEYCLFRYGPNNIGGAGNYFVRLTSGGRDVHTLYFLDSTVKKDGHYQPPTEGQVRWYEWAVRGMAAEAGGVVPSTLLIHIPLPEYAAAYDAAAANGGVVYGQRREKECASDVNSGLFEKIGGLGSTKGVFCGHDHVNDYSVMHEGVRLTYALSSGFGSYGDRNVKGGTVLTVRPDGATEQAQVFFKG
ncbi:MAG: metallophosphoesterase, partial [Clostridiales bacterium]|nr:metallophosphoesterase [Clostridiales bacterium]